MDFQRLALIFAPISHMPEFVKKLIFHTGSHKTGSSFLQYQLLMHRDALSTEGWAIPSGDVGELNFHMNHVTWLRCLCDLPKEKRFCHEASVVIENLLNWFRQGDAENLLISAEYLLYFEEKHWDQICSALAPIMNGQTTIHILCFVRDPLQHFPSLRNQMSKSLDWHLTVEDYAQNWQGWMGTSVRMEKAWNRDIFAEYHSYELAKQGDLWLTFQRCLGISKALPSVKHLNSDPDQYYIGNKSTSLESRWIFEALGTLPNAQTWKHHFHVAKQFPGLEDKCLTHEELEFMQSDVLPMLNAWLENHNLPTYLVENVEMMDESNPNLWSSACLEAWREFVSNAEGPVRELMSVAVSKIQTSSAPTHWHPDALARFNAFVAFTKAQTVGGTGSHLRDWFKRVFRRGFPS